MKRLLLLLMGAAVVAALILAPAPSEEDLFVRGVGQQIAGKADQTPPVFAPLVDTGVIHPGDTLRVQVGPAHITGFETVTEAMQDELDRALQRAVNQVNGGAGAPRQVELVTDAAAADLTLTLHIERFDGARSSGLSARPEYTAVPPRAEALPDAEAERFVYPSRTSLLPPLLAIALAIAFRRVLIALFGGVWLAGGLLTYHGQLSPPQPAFSFVGKLGGEGGVPNLWESIADGFLRSFDTFFHGQLVDSFRIEIIGFTLFLSAAVGVMSRSGGMAGLVAIVVRLAKGVRSSQFATWLMGLAVFFDDYANCIMVGHTMRPVTDRLRIAREKLAFIVDSTAAPVAAICVLSTWIAFEVSTFSAQLPPEVTDSPYTIFLQTLPYRYYAIFMLGFVLLTIVLQRDFGPMLRAEQRARRTGQLVAPGSRALISDEMTSIDKKESIPPLARRAVLPIATVLLVTLGKIWWDGAGPLPWGEATGWSAANLAHWTLPAVTMDDLREILNAGAGAQPILYGAFAGLVVALFLCLSFGARLGLVCGWVLAAMITGPASEALIQGLREGLPATEGTGVGDQVRTFLRNTVIAAEPGASSLEGSIPYVVFLLVFLVGGISVGLVAAALVGRDDVVERADRLTPEQAIRAALASTRAMALAIVILFLAWMIGSACESLGTASYLVAQLGHQMGQVYWLLPILLFLASCLVSFSTGSSWSTMGILLPIVVGLAYSIGEQTPLGGHFLMVLSIGSVLEGSIFGDHCSPISDTTVLSSVSSASDHIDHVRTQMPYAITVMIVGLSVGYLPQALQWWSWQVSMGLGIGIMFFGLLLFGRNPNAALPTAEDDDQDPSWSPLPPLETQGATSPLSTSTGVEPAGQTGQAPPWVD